MIDEGLRTWLETKTCRRDAADEYFHSGVKRRSPTGDCCDNCHPPRPQTPPPAVSPETTDNGLTLTPSKCPIQNGKRPMVQRGPATRREDNLKDAKDLLVNWRFKTWMTVYSEAAPYGPEGLLPDLVLSKIASSRKPETIGDLVGVGWSTSQARRHGEEVLELLRVFDAEVDDKRKAEQLQRSEAKKKETRERNKVKRLKAIEDRARVREAKKSAPKKPRASRAKKAVLTSRLPDPWQ
ncbi:hypothetical protein EDB19DRAFT_2028756 [Suillus lakei]|nr:hypothetical protein EDB19DRAFT_2028756 [Suillus lakei]